MTPVAINDCLARLRGGQRDAEEAIVELIVYLPSERAPLEEVIADLGGDDKRRILFVVDVGRALRGQTSFVSAADRRAPIALGDAYLKASGRDAQAEAWGFVEGPDRRRILRALRELECEPSPSSVPTP